MSDSRLRARRVVARAVDFVGLMALILGFSALFGEVSTSVEWVNLRVIPYLVALGCEVIAVWRWGATPGKLVFGLRVRETASEATSGRVKLRASLLRALPGAAAFLILWVVAIVPPIVGVALVYFTAWVDPQGRGIADRIAGTSVVGSRQSRTQLVAKS